MPKVMLDEMVDTNSIVEVKLKPSPSRALNLDIRNNFNNNTNKDNNNNSIKMFRNTTNNNKTVSNLLIDDTTSSFLIVDNKKYKEPPCIVLYENEFETVSKLTEDITIIYTDNAHTHQGEVVNKIKHPRHDDFYDEKIIAMQVTETTEGSDNDNNGDDDVEKERNIHFSTFSGSSSSSQLPPSHQQQRIGQNQKQPDLSQQLTSAVSFSLRWSNFIINTFHKPIIRGLQSVANISARFPIKTILIVILISIMIFFIGLTTNFYIESKEEALWTPFNSDSLKYKEWITKESLFNSLSQNNDNTTNSTDPPQQYMAMLFHSNGKNVLNNKQIRMMFNASDTLMMMPSYYDICKDGDVDFTLPNGTNIKTCGVSGVQRFWNFSSLWYDWTTTSNEVAIKTVSGLVYPGGDPVDEQSIYGYPVRDNQTGLLTSVLSYMVVFVFPGTDKARDVMYDFIDIVLDTNRVWQSNPETAGFYIEVISDSSYSEEFKRGIRENAILVPVVVFLMSGFCCIYFYRVNKVDSRMALGICALASIVLSLMQGFGLLFLCGVPFTSLTQICSFIIMGVGLDDAFIIIDTYERTNVDKKPEDRISDCIQECGFSIFLTTLTSTIAFAIGCTSSVPAIYWLCLYAFPTVAAVLHCQLTFFVACLVLDERRVQNRRLDCFCCCVQKKTFQNYSNCFHGKNHTPLKEEQSSTNWMTFFAKILLQPTVEVFVVISFLSLTGLSAWSASTFEQKFSVGDALPTNSYVSSFLNANEAYRSSTIGAGVYFRNEDFSSKYVRDQMKKYLDDLHAMKSVGDGTTAKTWPEDFETFLTSSNITSYMSFNDQLRAFLNDTTYCNLYCGSMVFAGDGTLMEYRSSFTFANVDMGDVKTQIDAYREQDAVTRALPINQGKKEPSFFTYCDFYNHWSFVSASVGQLIQSTVIGIIAVTAIVLLLMPHWTAAVFIFPITCMMYINILGILQWAGVYINAVTVVTVVISIGLIVDYIMHVLLRFYETPGKDRRERVIRTLSTMGSSVLAGGISTLLGTVPLIFGTNTIFYTIFMAFLSIVSVALMHGLIFLPVVLAWIGPVAENLTIENEFVKHDVGLGTLELGPQEINEYEGRFTF